MFSLIIISTWHLILLCLTPNKCVCIKKKCGIYSGNCASCHLIHIWAKTVPFPPQAVWFLTVLVEFWCVEGFSVHMQALQLVLRRRGSINVWSYWHQFDCIIISVCCTSCSHHCTYVCVRWEQWNNYTVAGWFNYWCNTSSLKKKHVKVLEIFP